MIVQLLRPLLGLVLLLVLLPLLLLQLHLWQNQRSSGRRRRREEGAEEGSSRRTGVEAVEEEGKQVDSVDDIARQDNCIDVDADADGKDDGDD